MLESENCIIDLIGNSTNEIIGLNIINDSLVNIQYRKIDGLEDNIPYKNMYLPIFITS